MFLPPFLKNFKVHVVPLPVVKQKSWLEFQSCAKRICGIQVKTKVQKSLYPSILNTSAGQKKVCSSSKMYMYVYFLCNTKRNDFLSLCNTIYTITFHIDFDSPQKRFRKVTHLFTILQVYWLNVCVSCANYSFKTPENCCVMGNEQIWNHVLQYIMCRTITQHSHITQSANVP